VKWMKVALVVVALSVLTGCNQKKDTVQEAMDFRTELMESGGCEFTAEITANLGSRVYDFTLDCHYFTEPQSLELTVTAPETIEGITATIEGEEAKVSFDGAGLELGTTAGGNIPPLVFPKLLGDAWYGGYIDSVSEDDDGSIVQYRLGQDDDEILVYTYFDSEMVPYYAEVFDDTVGILTASLENFSIA